MKLLACILVLLLSGNLFAQQPGRKRPANVPVLNEGGGVNPTQRGSQQNRDTLGFEQRDDLKDSISISFRYLDSTRRNYIDSSINDFGTYFPVPSTYQYLGNNGAAAVSLIFKPYLSPGFDPGFHAYDIYKFSLPETKIYRTTRPFSTLAYQLASGKEQMIMAMHTQNPKPNINFGFDYRLISAPGLFVTQNTNHNNFRIFGNYQGRRKRYNGTLIVLGNTIRASQNGGITNDSLLEDPNRKDRFSVPVNLGGSANFRNNPFITTITTGVTYKDFNFFLRQSYDLGKRDSIAINDSTTEYLFYPKLRIQHSFSSSTHQYNYRDLVADSAVYRDWYDISFPNSSDTNQFARNEKWHVISNDLSLIQYPDTKNSAEFLMAGATLENIKGRLHAWNVTYYNIKLHGEYRNRTRNRLWDMQFKGEFYLNGFNAGDYYASGSLARYLNKRFGDVRLHFTNVNRTPSYIFYNLSSFNLGNNNNYNKENITSFGATASNPFITFGFTNHLLANYTYFSGYYKSEQSSKVINVLQVFASKKFKLSRRINWYAEATMQQTGDDAPVKVPLLYTRNRIAFEGRFFKNLNLSTGLEVRYFTPYKAYNYSPIIGQFIPQDTVTIKNLPDVHAFLHFRIKTFTGFIRAENLNTASTVNGFGFINNNFAAPHYPTQGLIIRFGIKWWFVN